MIHPISFASSRKSNHLGGNPWQLTKLACTIAIFTVFCSVQSRASTLVFLPAGQSTFTDPNGNVASTSEGTFGALGFAVVALTFATPVLEAGIDVSSHGPFTTGYHLTDGSLSDIGGCVGDCFIGLSDPASFSKILIFIDPGGSFVVHDFSYTPAAVPEPASWPLLGIATAAAASLKKRRLRA